MKDRRPFHVSVFFVLLLSIFLGRAGFADDPAAVQHFVLLKFRGEADREAVGEVIAGFETMVDEIPGVIGFQWGEDNSPEGLQKGFTHAFVVTFKDRSSRDAYASHPRHAEYVEELRGVLDKAFALDFAVEPERALPPVEPGRVQHLVFFKFKDSATEDEVAKVLTDFAALELEIPGLLRFQGGANNLPGEGGSRFSHGFLVTFINRDARDDYLPHPAHRAFGESLGGLLEDALVVDFTVRPSARTLLVTEGLEPYKVYQRDADGVADIDFSGLAAGDGEVEARILSGRRVVDGLDWRPVGTAKDGRFQAKIEDIPAGGEYTVAIRRRDARGNVAEMTKVGDILVGDIWLLAGQSNMQGVGDLVDVEEPHPAVHSFTMAHRWELAVEPLHRLIDSRDPVHHGDRLKGLNELGRREKRAQERQRSRKGAGLGLPFAKEMVDHTKIPVGLIAAAHGGTSMSQWDPALRDEGGESLYGSMLKQVRRAGGRLKGVLWYQGESDASPQAAPRFGDRFKALIQAMRDDFGDATLPFYYVQIGRHVNRQPNPEWKVVQEAQRVLTSQVSNTAVVSVMDLPLDDPIHVGTPGLKRLGARLAKIARRELFGETELKIGPRLESARIEEGGAIVRVRFSNVNGRLHPAENIAGFSLRSSSGDDLVAIFNAAVDPEHPDTVLLKLRRRVPEDAFLWFGAGLTPFCNLVDSEDMGVLAFGPVTLKE